MEFLRAMPLAPLRGRIISLRPTLGAGTLYSIGLPRPPCRWRFHHNSDKGLIHEMGPRAWDRCSGAYNVAHRPMAPLAYKAITLIKPSNLNTSAKLTLGMVRLSQTPEDELDPQVRSLWIERSSIEVRDWTKIRPAVILAQSAVH